MRLSKAKIVVALGVVVAVAVGAVVVLQTDDGSEASSAGVSVGPGIRAVAAEDRGQSAPKAPRIIGGSQATIEQYPWQAAIAVSPSAAPGAGADDRVFCGGTIVAPTIVITAAHCVHDEGEFSDPSGISVISGRTELSSNQGVETPISGYRYFVDDANEPLYDPDTLAWDVAVLILPVSLIGSPLKIAGEAQSWAVGAQAWVSGWGLTGESSPRTYPDHLFHTTVKILDDDLCAQVYGTYSAATSLCAGGTAKQQGACKGDSGGPLVVSGPDGLGRLVGAVSYGRGECTTVETPGVYTRLAGGQIRASLQALVQELAGVDIVG